MTRRRALAGALVALLTLLALLYWRTPPARQAAAPATPPARVPELAWPDRIDPPDPMDVAAATGKQVDPEVAPDVPRGPAPVIDEITVEKTEVCRGEQNMISVRAHDPAGEGDAWFGYQIAGFLGQNVPVTYYDQDQHDTPLLVVVNGKDNLTQTTAEVPRVKVKDCVVGRETQIMWSLITNREDEFHFKARTLPRADRRPFTATRWAWDFGDGTTAITDEPVVDHSYLGRRQDRLQTTFIVRVEVTSAEGEHSAGASAFTLRNEYFVQRHTLGIVGLYVRLEPRFAVRDDDRVLTQSVRLWHAEPEAVRIDRVVYQDYTAGGEELGASELEPVAALGVDRIPREGVVVPLRVDLKEQPDLLMRRFEVHGHTADGKLKVFGAYSLMTPPEVGDGVGVAVTDERMKQRILAAQQLLGKTIVTDEEMQRLEEQGKLPPLEPPRAPPAGDPAWMDPNRARPAAPAK